MLKFSAISTEKSEVFFTLEDCPVYLSNSRVLLAKHPGSALLLADTIVRHDTETGFSEGDIVSKGSTNIGRIIYNKGFKLQTNGGKLKELNLTDHIKVKKGYINSRRMIVNHENRDKIYFRYKKQTFTLKAILQYEGELLVIHPSGRFYKKAMPSEVKLLTGIDDYCFGDVMSNGGRVVFHDLEPQVYIGDNYNKLSEI
ncbi:MAG: hypothetical protein IJE43_19520 [Alphaproteobacteria bacterium]|nr:hypothetical protein [Alphaproteobacteria bacterium]